MPVVAMPDGAQVQFPDDMPPAQIKALILQKFPDAGKSQAVSSDQAPPAPTPGTPAYAAQFMARQNAGQPQPQPAAAPPEWAGNNWRRGTIAPVERNEATGQLRLAVPQIALDAASAFALPGDVASGKTDPMSPEGLDRAALFGSMAAGGEAVPGRGVATAAAKPIAGADNAASAGIKSVASGLFDASKNSGITIAPEAYTKFIEGVTKQVAGNGLDKTLHPDTYAALTNLLQRRGQAPTFRDLHIARQIAQDASLSLLSRDSTKAGSVVSAIDDFVKNLKPADIQGAADPTQAANALLSGISAWSKGAKAATVEDAIYRAQNVASGPENGIRNEFRKILQNQHARRLFSNDELSGIEQVVRGTVGGNVMKLIGKFGFGAGHSANALGGAIGFGAGSLTPLGPLGGIIAALGAAGARKMSEKMTQKAADEALNLVATGAKKSPPKMVSIPARNTGPALLPFYEIKQNQR